MGIMLPNELVWIMEKLGFEWPDVDEDELRRAAEIIQRFTGELEDRIQAVDRKINGDMAGAMRGEAGPAFVAAWNSNRSSNLQRLLDALGPVPAGLEVAAVVVTGLKIKVAADVGMTALALGAMLSNPLTAGGAGLMLMAKKKLLEAAVETAIEEALTQILPMVIEPLAEQLPALVMAALDAPLVEASVGDAERFYADLQALEQAESDLDLYAGDIEGLIERLGADLSGLNITGG